MNNNVRENLDKNIVAIVSETCNTVNVVQPQTTVIEILTGPRGVQGPPGSGSGGTNLSASNGLNISGSFIKLGGTLTEDTTITGSYNFDIGQTGNQLSSFHVHADIAKLESSENSIGVDSVGSYLYASDGITGTVRIKVYNTGTIIPQNGSDNKLVVEDYYPNPKGLIGALDYSANLTDLSYIQKAWIISQSYISSSFPYTGSAQITGSLSVIGPTIITGSLTVSGSNTFKNIGPAIFSGSVNISSSAIINGYVDFVTQSVAPVLTEGRLFYDGVEKALSYYNSESIVHIGQEIVVRVFNSTGTPFSKGQVVKISGSQGDRPRAVLAQSVTQSGGEDVSNNILGVVLDSSIPNGQEGFVTSLGTVTGLSLFPTAQFSTGDRLFVSQSAGLLTNVIPPAPYDRILVGIVTRTSNGNAGMMYVRPEGPIHFNDISGVSSSFYNEGDLWTVQNSPNGKIWTNSKSLTGSYSISGSFNANSFTGSLQGTSSYATQALTASYASNSIPPFPYTGSAEITGSLAINGLTSTMVSGRLKVKSISDDIYGGITVYARTNDSFLALGNNNNEATIASTYNSTAGYKSLSLWTGDVRRVVIDASGNTTITGSAIISGSTIITGSTYINRNNSNTNDGIFISNTLNTAGAYASANFITNGINSGTAWVGASSTSNTYIGASNLILYNQNPIHLFTDANANINFSTNAALRMRILGTGAVQILSSATVSSSLAVTGSLTALVTGSDYVNFGNATTASQRLVRIGQDTSWVDIGSRVGTTSDMAIYFNAASPSAGSTQIWGNGTALALNGNAGIYIQVGTFNAIVLSNYSEQTFANFPRTSGAYTAFAFKPAASTGQDASTSIPNFIISGSNKQWNTGNITNQYWNYFTGNTASFVGASTITSSYGLFVEAAALGTNATITNNYALGTNGRINVTEGTGTTVIGQAVGGNGSIWFHSTPSSTNYFARGSGGTNYVNASTLIFELNTTAVGAFNNAGWQFQPSNNASVHNGLFFITPASVNGIDASAEHPIFKINGISQQWTAGNITTQRFNWLTSNTVTFTSSSLITNAYGLYVEAPVMGTNATASNNYAAGFSGSVKITGRLGVGVDPIGSNGDLDIGGAFRINSSIQMQVLSNVLRIGDGSGPTSLQLRVGGTLVSTYTTSSLTLAGGVNVIMTGSLLNTGSITAVSFTGSSYTGSFTGSLLGTASYALNATPPFPYTGSAKITGSLEVTGSLKINNPNNYSLELFNSSSNFRFGEITGTATIWANQSSPNSSNYFLNVSDTVTNLNGNNQAVISSANSTIANFNRTSGQIFFEIVSGISQTTNASSVEVPVVKIGSNTKTFNSGSLTNQRFIYFPTQTIAFNSSSLITNSYGLYVEAPTMGTNATASNNWAAGFDGNVDIKGQYIKFTGGITNAYIDNSLYGNLRLNVGTGAAMYVDVNGNFMSRFDANGLGIYVNGAKAYLHIAASSGTANSTPIKLNAGTLVSSPESGSFEFNGNNLFFTTGSTRNILLWNNNPYPITGSLIVTGSITTTTLTASQALISSSGVSQLTVIGSGSSSPLFTVQGSQGELFSITDNLSGSLFSVNDISGLPILEVFSDNTTLIGDYLDPMLITTKKVTMTNSGSFVIYSLPTASYDTAFFDYSIKSGSNGRAGQIMAIQSGSSVNFTETTTTDFGSTAGVLFTVIVSGSNMVLTGSAATGSWTIKTIVRGI